MAITICNNEMVTNMKKRILISVLLLALLFGILFGGIFLLRKNANEKEKIKSEEQTVELEKKTEKKEEQRKMDFVNVNLLEPYFSAEEIKSMEQQAEKLLKQDELFASITTLTCTDAIYDIRGEFLGIPNTKRQYRYNPGNMEGMGRRISS